MISSYSALLASLKEFFAELDDSFPRQKLLITLLTAREILSNAHYFLNNKEAFKYKGKAKRKNAVSQIEGIIEKIFLKMTTLWRETASPGCHITQQELMKIIFQTPIKRAEANYCSFHELHFFIAKGAYTIDMGRIEDDKKIDLNEDMIAIYKKKMSDKVELTLLQPESSWNILNTKRVIAFLQDPSQDNQSIENFFSKKAIFNTIDTSLVQLIHKAGIKSIKELLDWLHTNSDRSLFLDTLKKFVANGNRKDNHPTQFDNEEVDTSNSGEQAFLNYATAASLTNISFETALYITKKAPHLFTEFPKSFHTDFFLATAAESLCSEVESTLVALIEYPPCWDLLLPNLSHSLKQQLFGKSPLFEALRRALNTLDNSLSTALSWEEITKFLHKYPYDISSQAHYMIQHLFQRGKNYWKIFIDPEFHCYGPYVFDKGLAGGPIEPYFFQSMVAGLIVLCHSFEEFTKPKELRRYNRCTLFLILHHIVMSHSPDNKKVRNDASYSVGISRKRLEHFVLDSEEVLTKLTSTKNLCSAPSLTKIYYYSKIDSHLIPEYTRLYFLATNTYELVLHTEHIFASYERSLEKTPSGLESLPAITTFHQALERNHLFSDGNSRTDILMLQRELVAAGLPTTLVDPNDAYVISTSQWSNEILKGMSLD